MMSHSLGYLSGDVLVLVHVVVVDVELVDVEVLDVVLPPSLVVVPVVPP